MSENKPKERFIDRLKFKYRFVVFNDQTFEEVWNFRLSQLNVLAAFGVLIVLLTGLLFVLLLYTPLNAFLPVYTDTPTQRLVYENALRLDSLEYELQVRDRYLMNLKNLIEGKLPETDSIVFAQDTATHRTNIPSAHSEADSLLRLQVEKEEQTSAITALVGSGNTKQEIRNIHFFPPINKGMVVNTFNREEKHFGIDIVAAPNEGIMAVLDGTVISAVWSLEMGYVLQIQHDNDLVSVYSHNSALLKKTGDEVKAGEIVAIIGNTGELTTGPHLHFELWHRGIALNPENYIVF